MRWLALGALVALLAVGVVVGLLVYVAQPPGRALEKRWWRRWSRDGDV